MTNLWKDYECRAGKNRFGDLSYYFDSHHIGICQIHLHRTGSSTASTKYAHVTLAGQVLQHVKNLTSQVSLKYEANSKRLYLDRRVRKSRKIVREEEASSSPFSVFSSSKPAAAEQVEVRVRQPMAALNEC